MARSKKEKEQDLFRFMCVRTVQNTNYHVDFTNKEDALRYCDELNDSKIEWYGVYWYNPKTDCYKTVVSKRIIPHNDQVKVIIKEESKSKKSTRKSKRL